MISMGNFGKLAALSAITAAIVLLTGLPAVRADELADLRANQQLLQQRIDQLAQAQAQGVAPGAPPPPGISPEGPPPRYPVVRAAAQRSGFRARQPHLGRRSAAAAFRGRF